MRFRGRCEDWRVNGGVGGLTVVAAASDCSVPGVAAARAPIAGSMGYTRIQRLVARFSTPAISPGTADSSRSTSQPDGCELSRRIGHGTLAPPGHRMAIGSFTRSTRDGRSDLHVMDLSNAAIDRLTDGLGFNQEPSWSPDGTRIASASGRDGISAPLGSPRFHLDLYQMRSDATVVRRLTSLPGANDSPAWSPTGSRIAFVSDGDCSFDTFTMADDSHDHGQTTDFQRMGGFSATRDGRLMVRTSSSMQSTPQSGPAASSYSVGAHGNGVRRLTDGYDFKPDWSPASRWIVFLRQWQGHMELFIVRSDGNGVTQLTDDGADKDGPRWRPD